MKELLLILFGVIIAGWLFIYFFLESFCQLETYVEVSAGEMAWCLKFVFEYSIKQ